MKKENQRKMNKLLLSIIAILMIGFLAITWLLLKENERANRLAKEMYQQRQEIQLVRSKSTDWIPTYITFEDAQGREVVRGVMYPIYIGGRTEVVGPVDSIPWGKILNEEELDSLREGLEY